MKKIMTLMLGLSLVMGTAAFAADEKAGDAKPAGEKKAKKGKKNTEAKPAEAPTK